MPEASANGRNAAGPGWAPPAFLVKVAGVLVSLALTFLGLTAITFVIGRVMPVDPVLAIVGDRASDEVYQQVYLQLGLDKPIIVQYFRYLGQLAEGDLGTSIMTAQPVIEDIARFFPATLELATVATLLGVFVGVPLGVFAAVHQGRWIDHVVRVVALLGYSVPIFWLGLVALLIFYANLGWVAGPGRLDVYFDGIVEPRHRHPAARRGARRRLGNFPQRAVAPDSAGVDPRHLLARLHRAHDPQLHARPAVAGIRADRAGQGHVRVRASSGVTRSATCWCS